MALQETQILHGLPPGKQGGLWYAIPPVRLLDTRAGQIACIAPGAVLAGGSTNTYQVTSVCTKVPSDAIAIIGGMVSINNVAQGFLTIWPADVSPRPTASNLNYNTTVVITGRTFAVSLSPDGKVNVFTSQQTDCFIDIYGYFA